MDELSALLSVLFFYCIISCFHTVQHTQTNYLIKSKDIRIVIYNFLILHRFFLEEISFVNYPRSKVYWTSPVIRVRLKGKSCLLVRIYAALHRFLIKLRHIDQFLSIRYHNIFLIASFIYIWGGFQKNSLKDILLLYLFCLETNIVISYNIRPFCLIVVFCKKSRWNYLVTSLPNHYHLC